MSLLPNRVAVGILALVPGELYGVQASTDLVHWISLTNTVIDPATGHFTNNSATNYSFRFYRALGRLE
jgi:hypothetical protein